jgi:hypothetical protein
LSIIVAESSGCTSDLHPLREGIGKELSGLAGTLIRSEGTPGAEDPRQSPLNKAD